MTKDQTKTRRHRYPNDIDCFVLDTFLNRIYHDPIYINRIVYLWSPFRVPGSKRKDELKGWYNSPLELLNQYARDYGQKEGYDRPSKDKVYRALNELVKRKIIIPTHNTDRVDNEFKYYPNETVEGYIALLDLVMEDYQRGFYPCKKFGLNPIYSEFSDRILNRQFVMDILRTKVDCIEIAVGDHLSKIPLVGRYRKNYEMIPEIDHWIALIDKMEKILRNPKTKSYRPVKKLLLNVDERMPDDDYHRLTSEKRESNLVFLEKLRNGLVIERDYIDKYVSTNIGKKNDLGTINQFSEGNLEKYLDHFKNLAPDHRGFIDCAPEILGLNWYKDEAVWNEISLSDTDRKKLEDAESGFSYYYQDWINDFIIMPILCLIQLSPSALYAFVRSDWGPASRVLSHSAEHRRIMPFELPLNQMNKEGRDELANFIIHNKSYNELLGVLTRAALYDYMFSKVCIKKDRDFHGHLNRTQMISFGATEVKFVEDEPIHIPSMFTFSVYKEYIVSILFSECPMYNPASDLIHPVADSPCPGIYDWSPAVGYSYRKVYFPSARLYELFQLIKNDVYESDFYLSNMIDQALLKGTE